MKTGGKMIWECFNLRPSLFVINHAAQPGELCESVKGNPALITSGKIAGILHAYEEAHASSVRSHQPVTCTNSRYCSGSLADGGVAAHVAAFV